MRFRKQFVHYSVCLLLASVMAAGCCAAAGAAEAKSLVDQAKGLFKKRQFARALIMFEQALADDKDNADLLYSLGYVFSKLKNKASASFYLTKALEINPNHPRARKLLAMVEEKLSADQTFTLRIKTEPGMEILMDVNSQENNVIQIGGQRQEQASTTIMKVKMVTEEVGENGNARLSLNTLDLKSAVSPADLGAAPPGETYYKTISPLGEIIKVEGPTGPGNYYQNDLTFPEKPVSMDEAWSQNASITISGMPIKVTFTHTVAGLVPYNEKQCLLLKTIQTGRMKQGPLQLSLHSTSYRYIDPDHHHPLHRIESSNALMSNAQNGMQVKATAFLVGKYSITLP